MLLEHDRTRPIGKMVSHNVTANGIDFNPLTRIDCVVQYRGTDIFTGILRLSAVIENPNYTDYEVYIMGNVGDFASEIRNLTLQDLNWTDLQHELTYTAITQSWECKNNDTDGLFGGKVLYPMINYGLPYNGTTLVEQTLTFTIKGLDAQTTRQMKLLAWGRPHVIIKTNANNFFLAGLNHGMDVTTGTIANGTAMGDLNGYTLTLVGSGWPNLATINNS